MWEMRGRGDSNYWIYAEVYRNAHDERTYVARVEANHCWGDPGAWVHDIKFGFRRRRDAEAWVLDQRRVVRNKLRKARRRDVNHENS